jgi:hypothetical protein
MLGVFPQSTQESTEYLSRLGVPIADVRQAIFRDLKVRATPTLILVDGSGTVRHVWVGKLGADREEEVVTSALQLAASRSARHDSSAEHGSNP